MAVLVLSEQPPLIQAIFAGDVQEVIELINNKNDVNYQDVEKRSPLHAAAYKGDIEIISVLLENGARVNAKDNEWLTPLHRACYMNVDDSVIGLFLKYNADVCARDKLYQTPLHIAAANDAYRCIELLIDKVPNVNVTDRSGRTALHHAAYNGHVFVVESLITRGCIVNACDKKDFRPLHCAAQMGHIATVDLLIQYGADVNACDNNLYTPLHVAAASGNDNICTLLINAGAQVNACSFFGNSPLHIACLNGQLLVCQELIKAGADLELANYKGQTPLHVAAASAHGVECMLNLLSHKVNINKQSLDGRTPLHMTAIYGRFTRSKSLIDKGATIDCTDKNGCTPLHIAAQHGHDLLANTLMMHGANPLLRGYEGRTALHMCCLSGHVECCRKFLQAGVDLNVTDNMGRTPLHCAAYKGSIECLDLLISNGANFSARDNLGRLALHYAVSRGHYQCVFTLVGVGSNVNAFDNRGLTPLHLAAGYDLELRCVEYLLGHHAKPSVRDNNGFLSLHYAIEGGNFAAARLLIDGFKPEERESDRAPPKTTPLHLAAKRCPKIIAELLDADTSQLDARAEHGLTPLMIAAREGQSRAVELLVERGAVVSRRDDDGMTAVHHAARNGHSDSLLRLLIEDDGKRCLECVDKERLSPLMHAVASNQHDCVRTLLDVCAANLEGVVNMVDADQRSSLFRAVVNGNSQIVQLLLTKKARADLGDVNGKKVIHLAAACGHLNCLQILIDHLEPDEIRSFDNQMCTALHWASYTGHPSCVEILLQNDLFPKPIGNEFSPVHCASYAGSVKCLELLIDNYGDEVVQLKDCRKRSPLHIAALHGHTDCAKYLLDHGADVNALDEDERTPFVAATQFGQNQVIELLLNYQVNKGFQDKFGNTALHWACLMKHNQTAILLLEDLNDKKLIDVVNKEKKTPLHIAARNGLIDVTRELLKKGASVTAIDSEGYTPALCCAPNNNVAQCLALILLSLSLAPINSTEKNPDENTDPQNPLFAFLSQYPRFLTKNKQSQTEMSLLRDPDALEPNLIPGERRSEPPSEEPPRETRDLYVDGRDCFVIETRESLADAADVVSAPRERGLGLRKSFSDISIASQYEPRAEPVGLRGLKELCDRKKGCRECALWQSRCSDCTLRHMLRQHLQGKTSNREFQDFIQKTLGDTSSEYGSKLMRVIDSMTRESVGALARHQNVYRAISRPLGRSQFRNRAVAGRAPPCSDASAKAARRAPLRAVGSLESLRGDGRAFQTRVQRRDPLITEQKGVLEKFPLSTDLKSKSMECLHNEKRELQTYVKDELSKPTLELPEDFLKKLQALKLENMKEREEDFFKAIMDYIDTILKTANPQLALKSASSEEKIPPKLEKINEPKEDFIVTFVQENFEETEKPYEPFDDITKETEEDKSNVESVNDEKEPEVPTEEFYSDEEINDRIDEYMIPPMKKDEDDSLDSCLKIIPVKFQIDRVKNETDEVITNVVMMEQNPVNYMKNETVKLVPFISENDLMDETKTSSKIKLKTKREFSCVLC